MMAGLITNGYLLSPKRIEGLNRAGLDYLQISIDNIEPDEVSKKSLRLLDKKLQWLRDFAEFDVNINSVLGGGIKNPEDARTINAPGARARFLDVDRHHPRRPGHLKPLGPREREVWDDVTGQVNKAWQVFKNLYRESGRSTNLADGKPNKWHCRAGARYCTSARTAWSTTARSSAVIPACRSKQYTTEDIRRAYMTPKSCAPFCTIGASIASRQWTTGARRRPATTPARHIETVGALDLLSDGAIDDAMNTAHVLAAALAALARPVQPHRERARSTRRSRCRT